MTRSTAQLASAIVLLLTGCQGSEEPETIALPTPAPLVRTFTTEKCPATEPEGVISCEQAIQTGIRVVKGPPPDNLAIVGVEFLQSGDPDHPGPLWVIRFEGTRSELLPGDEVACSFVRGLTRVEADDGSPAGWEVSTSNCPPGVTAL